MGRERRTSRLAGNRGLNFPRDVPLITQPAKRGSIFQVGPEKPRQNGANCVSGGNNWLVFRVVAAISNTHGVHNELGPR